jgi:DNA-binding GntR family transcriptional regulator
MSDKQHLIEEDDQLTVIDEQLAALVAHVQHLTDMVNSLPWPLRLLGWQTMRAINDANEEVQEQHTDLMNNIMEGDDEDGVTG